MAKFRKKPVVVEAVQLRWDNWTEMCEFAGMGKFSEGNPEGCYVDEGGHFYMYPVEGCKMGLRIPTLAGDMIAREGDWVIRGIQGELYPCTNEIFQKTYERVD